MSSRILLNTNILTIVVRFLSHHYYYSLKVYRSALMAESSAFYISKGSVDIEYYYLMIKAESIPSMTDSQIIETLSKNGSKFDSQTTDIYINNSANVDYVMYGVAYDSKGNHGEVLKFQWKSPSKYGATVSFTPYNLNFTNGIFDIKTTKSSTCSSYYVYSFDLYDSQYEENYSLWSKADAPLALTIEFYMDKMTEYYSNGIVKSWNWNKEHSDSYESKDLIGICTWGKNNNGNMSGVLTRHVYDKQGNEKSLKWKAASRSNENMLIPKPFKMPTIERVK